MQANAYYTPRGSQGFAVHHDTHDVLVLQVAGEKRWLLYEPLLELPLKHQRYSQALGEHGEPTDDLVLRAGDTLYLPRGWLHQAETSATRLAARDDRDHAHTWLDAAKAALDAREDELAFRRGVEPGAARRTASSTLLAAQLEPELVASSAGGGGSSTRAGRSARTASPSSAPSSVSTRETRLERRETVIADLDEWRRRLVLVFEGREIRFPAHAAAEVRACFESDEPFRVAEPRRRRSTPRAASSSSAGSSARASCGLRAERRGAPTRQWRARAAARRLAGEIRRARPRASPTTSSSWTAASGVRKRTRHAPSPCRVDAEELEVVDAEQPLRLADRVLGRLHREASSALRPR